MTARAHLAIFLAVLFLPGCVGLHVVSEGEQGQRPSPHARFFPDSFSYDSDPNAVRVSRADAFLRDSHEAFFLEMPSSGKNGQEHNLVTARYFASTAPGKKRLVFILPIYGSYRYPAELMTEYFLQDGMNVVLIDGVNDLYDWDAWAAIDTPQKLTTWAEDLADRTTSAVVDIRRLLGWALKLPDIDSSRVGILGFSLGGLIASMVMGIDERISVGTFVMCGAHPHSVLAYADASYIKDPRDRMLAQFGWSPERFEQVLEGPLGRVDPVRYLSGVNPRNVLFISAADDNYFPAKTRADFWEALGRPRHLTVSSTHKLSFLSMTPFGLHRTDRAIAEFFNSHL